MEILAPVGNKESLDAVIRLRPDAVYFGLKDYNARIRTHNFSIDQANYITAICRSNHIKTYITLNTLLKNSDFHNITSLLCALEEIKPDGLIIQDLGLADVISRYFKGLEISASTQTTNLNSFKLRFLEKLSIKRAILERQLTLKEIREIKANSQIDIEVFILGAICYSISGNCLFSSFIGGNSANRGLCTQPCRRLYQLKNSRNYLFSIKDLDFSDYLKELEDIGIKGIKIEGRMKPGSYVYQAIKYIYEKLDGRDRDENIISRPFTSLMMDKKNDIYHVPVSGLFIGTVQECDETRIIISCGAPVCRGDIIRINEPESDKSSSSIKILDVEELPDSKLILTINKAFKPGAGGSVYLTGRDYGLKDPLKQIKIRKLKYTNHCRLVYPAEEKGHIKNCRIYITDNKGWLKFLKGKKVFYELEDYRPDKLSSMKLDNIYGIKLPQFLFELEIPELQKLIKTISDIGLKNLMISDEGQLEALPKNNGLRLFQDPNMKNLNSFSNNVYIRHGLKNTSFFIEGDIPSLLSMPRHIFITLYSRPILFASRIKPLCYKKHLSFRDLKNKKEFLIMEKNGVFYTVPRTPINAIHLVEKFRKYGFSNFIYDLRYIQPNRDTIRIIDGHKKENPGLFNLKKGLR